MSDENVEIVRASIAAFNAGDLEGALANVHPAVEWVTNVAAPDMGLFRGHDGLRELGTMLEEVFGEVRMETDEFFDAGEHVVVLGRLHVLGVSSGAATESQRAWLYTLRDGRIMRQLTYTERGPALEAAGLSE